MSESVVLCEGFHDRAFWSGWLARLGCTDPGAPLAGSKTRRIVYDPSNTKVEGGQFAYHSPTGNFIRIVPCHGKPNVLPAVRNRLHQRGTKAVLRLVINVDADTTATGTSTLTGLRPHDVLREVQAIDPAAIMTLDGDVALDGGGTSVSLVRWEAPDPAAAGLPDEHTLERLVCAAIIAAFPNRAAAVQQWLASRPAPPAPNPKEHAWSYMAGWYADFGCDAFYSHIWDDQRIADALEARLRQSGAWRVAENLAQ